MRVKVNDGALNAENMKHITVVALGTGYAIIEYDVLPPDLGAAIISAAREHDVNHYSRMSLDCK